MGVPERLENDKNDKHVVAGAALTFYCDLLIKLAFITRSYRNSVAYGTFLISKLELLEKNIVTVFIFKHLPINICIF